MANRIDKHNLFISLNKVKKASFLIGIFFSSDESKKQQKDYYVRVTIM